MDASEYIKELYEYPEKLFGALSAIKFWGIVIYSALAVALLSALALQIYRLLKQKRK